MNNIPDNRIDGTLSNKEKIKKTIDIGRLAILIAAITLLIAAAIFILLTDTPDEVPPEIILKDAENNVIDETYKLKFFEDADNLIHPGSEGTFDFVVANPHPKNTLRL